MLRQGGKSTSFVSGNRKTIHTTFSDGGELVEEYDVKTDELLLRKQRARTKLGGEGKWEYLVGDAPVHFNPEVSTIVESSSNVSQPFSPPRPLSPPPASIGRNRRATDLTACPPPPRRRFAC